MTEQVAEANTEAEKPAEPVFPDNNAKVTFKMITGLIEERNAQVGKINAVKGDADALRKSLEENSTDPKAVQARARRDQAQAALDEALEALHSAVDAEVVETMRDADGKAKEIEASIKEADGTIKPALNFFKKMYGDNLAQHLPALERLKGFSTRGAGSSGRRIRGYVAEVTVDGESTGFDNVAGVAKYLSLETADLQKAFFDAAGNPEKLADAPDRVEFSVTYTETYDDSSTEDKTATVVCTRKDDGHDEAEAETDGDEATASE